MSSPLLARGVAIKHISTGAPNGVAVPVDAIGNSGPYIGHTVKYNASGTEGAGFFAITGVNQGWSSGDANGDAFSPINASAFNVMSDVQMTWDVEFFDERNAAFYLDRFRTIETIGFCYIIEHKYTNPHKHTDVVARSPPDELVGKSTAGADRQGEEFFHCSAGGFGRAADRGASGDVSPAR